MEDQLSSPPSSPGDEESDHSQVESCIPKPSTAISTSGLPITAFAVLIPDNAPAKVAAHRGFERSIASMPDQYGKFRHCEPEMYFDQGAADLLSTQLEPELSQDSANSVEETEDRKSRTSIWDIKFIFDLAALDPRMCSMWAGGMGNQLEQSNVQFLLIDDKLCQEHIVFQLSPNSGGITITSGSKVANELYVNGDAVNDGQTVLGGVTRISIHGLQFRLENLPHSYTPEWHIQRDNFIKAAHRGEVADTLHLTRSAPSESWRCAGWTLQKEIGRGAEGVVYAATHKDDIVGVFKRVERTPRNAQAEAEKTEMPTDFSAEVDKAVRGGVHQWVIRLIAVFPPEYEQLDKATLEIEEKETLYYAYEPLCNETLHDHTFSTRDPCILRKRAMLFKSVLRALDFLHLCGYIHLDIKPANIGVKDGHAVLLDLDQMILQKGHPDIPASPGVCGTLAYLAPEREMIAHSYLVDVWSAGLVLFQMMYGYHPWKFMTNPFRSDEPDELVRSLFDRQYDEIIAMLKRSRNPLDPLLVRLLAHEYSDLNPGPRPSAKEALANPVRMDLEQW